MNVVVEVVEAVMTPATMVSMSVAKKTVVSAINIVCNDVYPFILIPNYQVFITILHYGYYNKPLFIILSKSFRVIIIIKITM